MNSNYTFSQQYIQLVSSETHSQHNLTYFFFLFTINFAQRLLDIFQQKHRPMSFLRHFRSYSAAARRTSYLHNYSPQGGVGGEQREQLPPGSIALYLLFVSSRNFLSLNKCTILGQCFELKMCNISFGP